MKADKAEQSVAKARQRADLARMRFVTSLDSTRRRLAPERLKEDALIEVGDRVDEAKDNVRKTLLKHPLMAGAAAIGTLALIFWKPARGTAIFGLRVAQLVWLNRSLWKPRP